MNCLSPKNTYELPTGSGCSLGSRESEPPGSQNILMEFLRQKSGLPAVALSWISPKAIPQE